MCLIAKSNCLDRVNPVHKHLFFSLLNKNSIYGGNLLLFYDYREGLRCGWTCSRWTCPSLAHPWTSPHANPSATSSGWSSGTRTTWCWRMTPCWLGRRWVTSMWRGELVGEQRNIQSAASPGFHELMSVKGMLKQICMEAILSLNCLRNLFKGDL